MIWFAFGVLIVISNPRPDLFVILLLKQGHVLCNGWVRPFRFTARLFVVASSGQAGWGWRQMFVVNCMSLHLAWCCSNMALRMADYVLWDKVLLDSSMPSCNLVWDVGVQGLYEGPRQVQPTDIDIMNTLHEHGVLNSGFGIGLILYCFRINHSFRSTFKDFDCLLALNLQQCLWVFVTLMHALYLFCAYSVLVLCKIDISIQRETKRFSTSQGFSSIFEDSF